MANILLSRSKRVVCMVKPPAVSSRCVSTLPLSTHSPSSTSRLERKGKCNPQEFPSSISSMRIPYCNNFNSGGSKRSFSKDPSSWESEFEGLIAQRNKNITMHPESHSQHILPGNFVLKKHPKTGAEKKVYLEHALGYFWAWKELTMTDNKPILSNETIIPASEAEKFPTLKALVNLHDEVVDIPDFFTRNNCSKDANAQCTLVAVSCKDFGAKLLPSWTKPFENTFCNGKDADRCEVVRITINEGRIAQLLSPFIMSGTKKNVTSENHPNTLLYYGDAEEFRDILRMHNIYTSFVYLVDGIGRIRWVGSGGGSDKEVQSMINIAQQLTVEPNKRAVRQKQLSGRRVGNKVPRN